MTFKDFPIVLHRNPVLIVDHIFIVFLRIFYFVKNKGLILISNYTLNLDFNPIALRFEIQPFTQIRPEKSPQLRVFLFPFIINIRKSPCEKSGTHDQDKDARSNKSKSIPFASLLLPAIFRFSNSFLDTLHKPGRHLEFLKGFRKL
ncbi:Uncharacterised protein [Mycobacteroides abscessus subsp. abscessus]|nr:Uncharacterised protein [Mycobacteroides abscessus subsp. abscessus]